MTTNFLQRSDQPFSVHYYSTQLIKVVDGDTVIVDIDLGFNIWLRNESVRLFGIDTPESRTSDPTEKIFGNLAKDRLTTLLGKTPIMLSQRFEDNRGKFGRILATFLVDGTTTTVTDVLVAEGLAVPYFGQSKEDIRFKHLQNRHRLISEGKIVIPT